MRSIRETALAFDRACTAAGVRYAIVGGFAVMAWGQPRATMDVDAVVAMAQPTLQRLVKALAAESLNVSPADLQSSLSGDGHASIFDAASAYHVDVKAARTHEEKAEVDAAVEVSFGDGRLMVARPEDTVAYKLLFGTPQDVKDAESILVRQAGALDEKRLTELCERLGVAERLRGLRRQGHEEQSA